MANFPVDIVLNISGEGELRAISQTLRLMREESSTTAEGINTLVRELSNVNSEGFNSLVNSMNNLDGQISNAASEMQNFAKSVNEARGDQLKTINDEIKNIAKSSSETANSLQKMNFSKLESSVGVLKSIDNSLKTLLSTLERIKSNENIRLNFTTNASEVNSQIQSANNKYRSHNYKTGSGNAPNYYGFSADNNLRYQMSAPIKNVGTGFNVIGEKMGRIGDTLLAAGTFLGFKELNDVLVKTPGKAETQKYLLNNMQGTDTIHTEGGSAPTTLYKTLDKTTDQLPISMQNVVQPLYAFQAATGSSAQQINDIIPEFTNFGAQVLNMTGSEEQAETAMQKLSYAFQGQYAAVDQFGITEKSLADHGFKKGDTDVGKFMQAVTEIVGDAKGSMQNYEGLKALVGKDFSRAGKNLWNNGIGQTMNSLVGGYHNLDSEFGGGISELIVGAGALMNTATTLTSSFGAISNIIGTFGEVSSEFKAIRANGGGLLSAYKGVFQSDKTASYNNPATTLNNLNLEKQVYSGAYKGVSSGITTTNSLGNSVQGINSNFEEEYRPHLKPDGSTTELNSFEERANVNKKYNNSTKATATDLGKMAAASDSFTNQLRENNEIIKESKSWTKSLKKSLTSPFTNLKSNLKKFGSSLVESVSSIGVGGALGILGVAATGAGLALKYAGAHSQEVADSYTNLQRALGNGASALTDSFGNFLYSIGLTDSSGSEGTYKALAGSINMLAESVNRLAGVTPEKQKQEEAQERDTKKKEEADKTGEGFLTLNEREFANANYYYDPDTKTTIPWDKEDKLKVDAMHDQLWWGNALELSTSIFNPGKLNEVKAYNKQQEELIKAGDYHALHTRRLYGDAVEFSDEELLDPFQRYRHEEEVNHNTAKDVAARNVFMPNEIPTGAEVTIDGKDMNSIATQMFQQSGWGIPDKNSLYDHTSYHNDNASNNTKGTNSDPMVVTNADNVGQNPFGDINGANTVAAFPGLAAIFGGLNVVSAKDPDAQDAAMQAAINHPNSNMGIPNPNVQGNATDSLNTGDGSQKGMEYATQFTQGFQQGLTATPIDTNSLFGGQSMDLTMKGTEMSNQLVTGFNTSMSGASFDISGAISALSSKDGQFNSTGQNSGNKYKSGISSTIGGASDVAQQEANEVVSALQSAVDGARAAGEAAGRAFHEGFTSTKGDDINSPGRAARYAKDEAGYLVSALRTAIVPSGVAGWQTGAAYSNAINSSFGTSISAGLPNFSGALNSVSNGVNINGEVQTSSGDGSDKKLTDNKNVNITNNFHIDKIDSKERVKEIAETLVHIMTFNNETAGRNTNIGL